MNKLLKDAIADAKAVRETALANAKLALEEAFQPKLQKMFSEKIKHEMEEDAPVEDDDSTTEASMDMENEMMNEPQDEMARMKELAGLEEYDEFRDDTSFSDDDDDDDDDLSDIEDYEPTDDEKDEFSDSDDEDAGYDDEDLEEIIRQLEEDDMKDEMAPDLEEGDDEEELPGSPTGGEYGGEFGNLEEDLDEEINLDEVIAALREDEDGDTMEDEGMMKENFDQIAQTALDGIKQAWDMGLIKGDPNDASTWVNLFGVLATGLGTGAATMLGKKVVNALKSGKKADSTQPSSTQQTSAVSEELNEAYSVIEHLREKINEVNLLNAKLLYVNKLFKKHNLSESEKVRVVETFDRAVTVRETKIIYTTLSESLSTRATKKTKVMTEGFASSPVKKTEILTESNSIVSRFQKLAGLTNED